MTPTSVVDYRGEPGTSARIADALAAMPVVLDGTFTDVHLSAFTVPHYYGEDQPLQLRARKLRGFRREGEHPARPHHLRLTSPAVRGGSWHHRLIVSPGGVQISTARREGWEPRRMAPREVRGLVAESTRLHRKLEAIALNPPDGCWRPDRLYDGMLNRVAEIRDLLSLVKRDSVRGEVTGWSDKSQRRMIRRIASLDWATFTHPGYIPAMVTLTYPGDWLSFAPDGRTAKRHLNAFRSWYGRRTRGLDKGIWKLEFQRRGAPHFHLLMLVPNMPTLRRDGLDSFADECRAAWHRIVKAGVPGLHGPFTRGHPNPDGYHARAGVSIDVHEGGRMVDPVRIGAYFAKHGRHAGKAYQHEIPDEWARAADADETARPGRWWGYWRLEVQEFSGELAREDTVELRRMLRRWIAAQGPRDGEAGSPVLPRAFPREVWRVQSINVYEGVEGCWHAEPYESIEPDTGEVIRGRARKRRVSRRFKVATLQHPVPTGFVLVNDAPALVHELARAFGERQEWPPGQRRPLP